MEDADVAVAPPLGHQPPPPHTPTPLPPHEYFISCSCVRLSLTNFCWGRERRGGIPRFPFSHMLLTKIAGQTDTRAIGEKRRRRSYKSSSFFEITWQKGVCVLIFSLLHFMTLLLLLPLLLFFLFPARNFPHIFPRLPLLSSAFNFKSRFAAAKTQGFPPPHTKYNSMHFPAFSLFLLSFSLEATFRF